MSTFDDQGRIPMDKGVIILCVGKKRSGKSKLAMRWFMTYQGDRVVIDVAGDDGPIRPDDPQFVTLSGTVRDGGLPDTWPEHLRQFDKHMQPLPMTLVYSPDAGSPTHLEDIDHVVGLAYDHGECCLLIHEVASAAPANRTPANMRRVLNHNRHRDLTALFCGPRPATVDPLVISQADIVEIFDLPNRLDRERVADYTGWDREDMSAEIEQLAPHGYLQYDSNVSKPGEGEADLRLVTMPPLPEQEIERIDAWAFPKGKPKRHRQLAGVS